jgi:ArsR family metal-binding transcriptional regulator
MATLEQEAEAMRNQMRIMRRIKKALDDEKLSAKHRERVVVDIAEAYLSRDRLAELLDSMVEL